MLVIFSGGSGVGKNTVIKELIKDGGYALLPTYTTRDKRPGESEGDPYCFITEEQFKGKIESGELYEYENVHGHYYGTSRKLLKEKLALNKTLLKDIDVLGTQSLTDKIDDVKIVTLFLKVRSKDILVERLMERKEKEIDKRLLRYDFEMSFKNRYDYIIDNVELQETKDLAEKIVAAEKAGEKPTDAEDAPIDGAEIKSYAEKLLGGEILDPVHVSEKDGKFYIISGKNRYLAGLSTGKRVAKELVKCADIKEMPQTEWLAAIEKFGFKK